MYRAWYGDEDCILRVPRRKSDTQQESAMWEHLHTLRASELRLAPKFMRPGMRTLDGRVAVRLYILMERYSSNLEEYLMQERPSKRRHTELVNA